MLPPLTVPASSAAAFAARHCRGISSDKRRAMDAAAARRRSPRPTAALTIATWPTRIRALAMDAVEQAKSGHPGMPMGMADVATVLFTQFLKFDPAAPDWPDRDRFVLSAGHGSMLLYALLHLTGYPDMTIDELKRFRQLGSRTAGPSRIRPRRRHRDHDRPARPGPRQRGRHGARRAHAGGALRRRRWSITTPMCIAGDGCLMEGISHEAISLAGHLRLNKLIVLFDDNRISIDGPTALAVSDDQLARFARLRLGAPSGSTATIPRRSPPRIAARAGSRPPDR